MMATERRHADACPRCQTPVEVEVPGSHGVNEEQIQRVTCPTCEARLTRSGGVGAPWQVDEPR